MSRVCLFLFILFNTQYLLGQSHVDVLIGKSETEVRSYLQTLINKSQYSSSLQIKQTADDGGDMVLNLDLPSNEQEKFGFFSIITKFVRIDGKEFCYVENILGSQDYAEVNLSFIKDNYVYIESGKWKQSKNSKV